MTTETPPRRVGLVYVFTGHGKGKTSAALGIVLRAWGRNMKVAMLQFIKAKTANFGEIRAAKKMGVEITPLGDGFTWRSKDIDKDKALARECWAIAKEKILSGDYEIVILDELTYALTYGWLDADEVLETLKARPPLHHVVITGRDAPDWLKEYADLVTEMREVKHPYKRGIKAQPGLEF